MKMGKSVREAFGLALAKIGAQYPDLVVLDGDVHKSTRTEHFAKKFPDRFFNVGIAESDLVGIASGMAASGKRAWLASFACFIMCNAYDQLRMSVAFPALDVKVVGTHAGISIGEDGPSQMGLEDLAMMRAVHGSTVLYPCDPNQTAQLVEAMADLLIPAGKDMPSASQAEVGTVGLAQVLKFRSELEAPLESIIAGCDGKPPQQALEALDPAAFAMLNSSRARKARRTDTGPS